MHFRYNLTNINSLIILYLQAAFDDLVGKFDAYIAISIAKLFFFGLAVFSGLLQLVK